MSLFKYNGFFDLNVHDSCFEKSPKSTLQMLYNLGYRTIAVNQTVDVDSGSEVKKKKKKGEPRDIADVLSVPFNIQPLKDLASELNYSNITFLNRVTLVFSTQDSLQKYIKSPNYKKYDLVAVIPTTLTALMYVCGSLEADILSFNPENKFNLKLSRKVYNQLVDKGYHFELTYSLAIQDSTKRKNLINLSHLYHTFGKSRNIIFSSGAENPLLLRGAYDIINLGYLFGLSTLQAKNSISHCPRTVIINATGRRHGKAIMMVENIEEIDFSQSLVIVDSDEDDMDTDEPVQKKPKQ